MVPKVPPAPVAFGVVPDATVSGGQAVAHTPEQALDAPESALKVYKVRPEASTRILPPIFELDVTSATSSGWPEPPAPAGAVAVVVAVVPEALGVDDPQAAASTATTATATVAARGRRATRRGDGPVPFTVSRDWSSVDTS